MSKSDETGIAGKKELDGSAEVCRVGVRIPPFRPDKPAMWFSQIEGQFALSGITTDITKFYYITSQLDPQYADEVEDIILSPPDTNKYGKLKDELIKRLSASRDKKIKQLLMHEELGDRKPSQFLRHLQHLAGPGVPDDFVKALWSERLPTGTQTIIASQQTTLSLEALADLADRIHDIVTPTHNVAVTSKNCRDTTPLAELTQQVAELTRRVEALNRPSRSRRGDDKHRDRSHRSTSRCSTRSPSRYKRYPTCWYHTVFGARALKCTKPCDYKEGNDRCNR